MRITRSTILHVVFGLVGLGLFGLLVYRLDFKAVAARLREVGWWFLAVLVLHAVALAASTRAWQVIMNKDRSQATFSDLFKVFWAGSAVNYVTPGATLGEVLRATVLKHKVEPDELVASVISFGFYSILVAQVFTFIGPVLALSFLQLPRSIVLGLFIVALGCFVPLVLIYVFIRMGAVHRLTRLALRLPFLKRMKRDALIAKATAIDACIQELTRNRSGDLRRAFGWMAMARLTAPIETWLLLSIFMPGRPPLFLLLVAVFTLSASQIISWVVSFVPGQIGFSEGGMTLLFKLIGLDPLVGFSLEIVRRLRMVVAVAIGLVLAAWVIRSSRKAEAR